MAKDLEAVAAEHESRAQALAGEPLFETPAKWHTEAAAIIRAAIEETERLRADVVTFCGPWAAQYAAERDYPKGHLHPAHYDILAKAGARMDDFIRHEAQVQS